ncbi:MAG: hypothetical protein ACC634_00385 [Hyphomicrobiales bacterium]
MTRKKLAPLPAVALAGAVMLGVVMQPGAAMAQSACMDEASGGTRAMLKQAIACLQETSKATSALQAKTAANTAAISAIGTELGALKSDVRAVSDALNQVSGAVAGIEVMMGSANEKLAKKPMMPDLSKVTEALGQRFDTLAARLEKVLAENRTPAPSN